MSELLNSLNGTAPDKSFSDELAAASAAFEAEQPKPEPGMEPATDPTPDMRLSGIPSDDDEVAPPQKGEVQESPAQPEKQDRTVPLKALQEERQKRAELERRIAMLEQLRTQPQEPEQAEEEIDEHTDPIGALTKTRQELAELKRAREQEVYVQQLNQIASRAEAEFSQKTPDYTQARDFIRQGRAKELQMFGVPNDQIPVIIANEERQLVQAALQQRRNPAEVVYEIAKARGHGVQAAPPPVQPAAPDPVAKTELQAAKQAVAPSVSSGGKPPKGELTPEALLNLNGAAFDAAWNKMFKGNKSSLFRD
jgi:hypothetical protein